MEGKLRGRRVFRRIYVCCCCCLVYVLQYASGLAAHGPRTGTPPFEEIRQCQIRIRAGTRDERKQKVSRERPSVRTRLRSDRR